MHTASTATGLAAVFIATTERKVELEELLLLLLLLLGASLS
jgi:hypothetical protein